MAFSKPSKSPFAHEIDRFHVAPASKVRWNSRKLNGSSQAAKEGTRSSDFLIAALGIALGLGCAFFPWYIFFNQEKFGVRPMKFEGGGAGTSGPVTVGPQPQRIGPPMTVADVPIMQLDLFSTGALPDDQGSGSGSRAPVDPQPFPADVAQFRLVHVANGRAMIEDDTGLWVVQAGSMLPDSSRVAGIEKRGGKWVLVTSTERVVELTP